MDEHKFPIGQEKAANRKSHQVKKALLTILSNSFEDFKPEILEDMLPFLYIKKEKSAESAYIIPQNLKEAISDYIKKKYNEKVNITSVFQYLRNNIKKKNNPVFNQNHKKYFEEWNQELWLKSNLKNTKN